MSIEPSNEDVSPALYRDLTQEVSGQELMNVRKIYRDESVDAADRIDRIMAISEQFSPGVTPCEHIGENRYNVPIIGNGKCLEIVVKADKKPLVVRLRFNRRNSIFYGVPLPGFRDSAIGRLIGNLWDLNVNIPRKLQGKRFWVEISIQKDDVVKGVWATVHVADYIPKGISHLT